MCVSVDSNQYWRTRNGSLVKTSRAFRGRPLAAEVIQSDDPKTPVGTVVTYQSEMGHVLCGGNHDDSCALHPLDAEDFYGWTSAPLVTKLHRNHYNRIADRKAQEARRAAAAKPAPVTIDGLGWPPKVKADADERLRLPRLTYTPA